MDLDFKNDKFRFNARVSAIIYNKDKTKVLLFKVNDGRDFYMLPGGRIRFNEDSKSAIEREILEEIGYKLSFNLCSIEENFLEKETGVIMQYSFCYMAFYDGDIDNEKFDCLDNKGQSFYWFDLNKICGIKIFPNSAKENIFNNNKNVTHFINRV